MTLVCFAVPQEAGAFQKLAGGTGGVTILVTGMGRINAARAVEDFVATHPPARVFTCGFAGGLNPALAMGEVLFETGDSLLAAELLSAQARPARFFCSTRVATTVAEKSKLRSDTRADAVEMESAAVQALCREHGIPCATVRAISDPAHQDLPLDLNSLTNDDLSLNHTRLALAIARSPGRIPALWRLQQQCRHAAARLAEVLLKVVIAQKSAG